MKIEEEQSSIVHRIVFTSVTEEDLGEYSAVVENVTSTGKLSMKSKLGFVLNEF